VTGIHYRHPAILANMATTLDIVSGGRLELGLGAGWNEEESGGYGIELGTPGQRSDRFEEACEVIVGLFTQVTTTFKGQYYQLSDARNEPKPVQRPHPPLCVGGSGEKRTLRTAARFAQHWNFVGGTPEEFTRKREILHQHCEDLGRDPTEILLSSHVRYAGNPKETAEQAAAMAAVGVELGIVYFPPPLDPRLLEPLATSLREL
jgi:alkanesulfonate monooxygenase SsuD/methylene tetrahydromethanopterin reductase-like flavin-dependent oxidoreductase (luciferase family)